MTDIEIPDGVRSIGQTAFSQCSGLTSLTIPNSVTTIGESAFENVPLVIYNGTVMGSPWKWRSK